MTRRLAPSHVCGLLLSLGCVAAPCAARDSFLWVGGSGLNWGTASNWQPNQVPGVDVIGADALILSASGTVTNGGAGNITLNSLQASAPVSFINGVVTMQSAQIADLLLSSDVKLTVGGDLLLTGSSSFGWCTINGSRFSPIQNQGELHIQLTASCTLNKPLENSGPVTQFGDVALGRNSFIHNTGSWDSALGDANIAGAPSSYFDNSGTFKKTQPGNADIFVYFFNDSGGAVEVSSGDLRFRHEGTHGSSYALSNNASITFLPNSDETIHVSSSASVTGQGDFKINGSFEVKSNVALVSELSDASPNGLWLNSASPITLDGTIYNEGKATWTTLTLEGNNGLHNRAHLLVPGGFTKVLKCLLVNESGGVVDQTGSITLNNGTAFNDPGATWNLTSGSFLLQAGTTRSALYNAGTMTKTGVSANDTSFVNPPINHTGLFEVVGPGKLVFGGGGAIAGGVFDVTTSATAVLDAGLYDVTGGALFIGEGALQLDAPSRLHCDGTNANNLMSGGSANTGLRVTGGEITSSGNGVFHNHGWMELEGAALGTSDHPECEFVNDETLLIESTSSVRGVLSNEPEAIVGQSANLQVFGGALENFGTWELLASADILKMAPGGSLHNYETGFFVKDADSILESVVAVPVDNEGVVQVEGGTLTLSDVAQVQGDALTGGTWIVKPGATLRIPNANITDVTLGAKVALLSATAQFVGLVPTLIGPGSSMTLSDPTGGSFALPLQQSDGAIFLGGPMLLDLDGQREGELDNGILGEIEEQVVISANDGAASGPTLKVAHLNNAGTLRPGGAATVGEFMLVGALHQLESGRLEIEASGAAAGAVDHVQVDGAAQLAGTIVLSALDGFAFAQGQSFRVLDATAAVTGQIAVAVDGFRASAAIDAQGVTVTIDGARTPADLDGDGLVGPTDLGILLGGWGTTNPTLDLNDDGIVGAADLAILLGAWTS